MKKKLDNSLQKDLSKKKKKKEPLFYRDIPCDSNEEIFFLMWAFELKESGYISDIKRAKTYSLSNPVIHTYKKITQLKSKVKEENKDQKLLGPHEYTPEFEIVWTKKGVEKFIWKYESWNNNKNIDIKFDKTFIGHENFIPQVNNSDNFTLKTLIEVKPMFDQNNMTRLFKINQKWVWDKYHLFVNLVYPQKLFNITFTPKEYMITTHTNKQRKITYENIKTLQQYLEL